MRVADHDRPPRRRRRRGLRSARAGGDARGLTPACMRVCLVYDHVCSRTPSAAASGGCATSRSGSSGAGHEVTYLTMRHWPAGEAGRAPRRPRRGADGRRARVPRRAPDARAAAALRARGAAPPPAPRAGLRRRPHGLVPVLPRARGGGGAAARAVRARRGLVRGLDARLLAALRGPARRHGRLARPAPVRRRPAPRQLHLAPLGRPARRGGLPRHADGPARALRRAGRGERRRRGRPGPRRLRGTARAGEADRRARRRRSHVARRAAAGAPARASSATAPTGRGSRRSSTELGLDGAVEITGTVTETRGRRRAMAQRRVPRDRVGARGLRARRRRGRGAGHAERRRRRPRERRRPSSSRRA